LLLEGPAFDREGNLYMVDIPYGRILRMSPRGDFDVAAEYDGWPTDWRYTAMAASSSPITAAGS